MHAGRVLYTCHHVKPINCYTACYRVLDVAADRAHLHMLAQDLPTLGRSASLHQFKITWHFGRAAYCTSIPATDRSLRRLINPRLTTHFTRGSTAAGTRHCERSYVCAAASVLDGDRATSTSQACVPKFGRRTSVKDVKVSKSADYEYAFDKMTCAHPSGGPRQRRQKHRLHI